MFSRIAVKECIPLHENFLEKKNTQHIAIKEVTNLFRICITQNYFSFDNSHYSQNDKIPIGSPISFLLTYL